MRFDHILFPVDFSGRAFAAAPHVHAMAKKFAHQVTLMDVVEPFWNRCSEYYPIDPSCIVYLKNQLRKQLDNFGRKHLPGVSYHACSEEGDPAAVITRFAHEHGVGLIMMPSHGFGPFRSLLLGSVTAKVLHDVECPVWTTAHMETPYEPKHADCENVMCAIDLGPRSVSLMQWAARLAESLNAQLRFVHARPAGLPALGAQEKLAEFQEEAGVSAPACVEEGSPGSVVEHEAKRHDADLVVIGRGCLHGKTGRLRTHSYDIIRRAPCPVISV